MGEDYYCPECGRRLGQSRIHISAILALLVVVGVCVVQIYGASDENHRQFLAISSLNREILALTSKQDELSNRVTILEKDLVKYKLRRPTYGELQEFLRIDETDRKDYQRGQYVCINYAADLKRNAVLFGYNISFVSVNFDHSDGSSGHALNGAYLFDGSWVWIEPQKDRIYYGTIEDCLKSLYRVSWVKVSELAIIW